MQKPNRLKGALIITLEMSFVVFVEGHNRLLRSKGTNGKDKKLEHLLQWNE